ncbi:MULTISPECIES: pseudouridine synthase [Actinomycetospora]|uniref:Pseudouridine synthase n=1 Tax=Actinomycetospora chibensis TaxID=663606 RepID=A0ABV9RFQ6_9PSEU|nr:MULTISPECIES: pseudouridine synthase [Actinomycetospora]MDD7921427.1 pseudouridine synthase [Actinomycetospora callitridis]MDD7927681.1 pseudouridine synthase [Actinomycetospora chibensis]
MGESGEGGEGIRLQKVLAEAGVASRRQAEILMRQGRVEVDGKVVKEMGLRVDPDRSVIHVDGDRIVTDHETVHFALNKPEGMLSTMWDDQGRRCVGDVILEKSEGQRLFHVGRLDAATEGLLLLTNDGELANRLMHPSYEVPKTYLAEVRAPIPKDLGRQLRAGVELDDGPAAVDSFKVIDRDGARVMVEVVLHEGRKHIVRRMLEAVDKPVQRLVRTAVGDVRLGEQRPGTLRKLGRDEVGALYRAVGL